MRRVSFRPLAALALLIVLSFQSVAAEPRTPGRNIGERIKHLIFVILDELGGPHG
jgi:hypothetical protein